MNISGQDISLESAQSALIKLERDHSIKLNPTAAFLEGVRSWLGAMGVKASLDGAWQFWQLVFTKVELLRESAQNSADLAFWFGVNPYALSDHERVGLLANLNRVRAQDILRRCTYSPTDYRYVYDLVLAATGDEKQATKARADAMELHIEHEIRKDKANASR